MPKAPSIELSDLDIVSVIPEEPAAPITLAEIIKRLENHHTFDKKVLKPAI